MVFLLIPVYMINICILGYCILLVQVPATVFKSEINETAVAVAVTKSGFQNQDKSSFRILN